MARTTIEIGRGPWLLAFDASLVLEAIRYFTASVAALTIDAALLWLGTSTFAWPVWLAGAIAYSAGLVLVYWLSVRWVFARRAVTDRRSEFLLFTIVGLIGIVVNSATLQFATQAGLTLPIAKAIAAGIGFVVNFVGRKALLFSTPKP